MSEELQIDREPPGGRPIGAVTTSRPTKTRMSLERRVLLLALLGGLPGVLVSLILLWTGDFTLKVQWTLAILILGAWWGFALTLQDRVVRPLQTLSNLLAALREDDYSLRARSASHGDALGEVMLEVNALGETLREQRLGALEAANLLRTVMAEIDVAVFAFDGEQRLRLVNRAGERLLTRQAELLLGRKAEELGLAGCLEEDIDHTLQLSFPGGNGRWGVRRGVFWERGRPHRLLVLSDLSRALREEERQAWQRLIRVLGHELNNSLTPIKSIAGSLKGLLDRQPRPDDWEEDARRGLAVIEARAESLSRFMSAYSRLARLPAPTFKPVDVRLLVDQVTGLETRLRITRIPEADTTVRADRDQLEQLLINLLRNAVDAALETGGGVRIGWNIQGRHLELWIEDDGPGLSNTTNLFVPFFTTKPGGSGIGLVLCRQIAEAHGGTLTLANRPGAPGCCARLRLPV